jgi:hypothetical protein
MTTRRKIAWWAACAAIGTGIAIQTAPDSGADSSSFLDVIHDLGWYNRAYGDVGLLNQGYAVCRALDAGYNGAQVAGVIYANTGLDVSREDAAIFVIVAVENLCPQFDQRPQAVA